MTSGTMLPDYGKPPVVEVIFAAAFAPLAVPVVDLARFGLERLGEEFPIHQDQPPTRMPTESFEDAAANIMPALALLTGAPPIRLWFQSEDRTRLVQLQRDWLAYNWQGSSGDSPYPRYEQIETRFLQLWDSFSDFLRGLSGDTLTAQHCELSYINHIAPDGLWERPGQLDKVLRLVGVAGDYLPEPEDGQIAFRYRIKQGDRNAGRLYIQATPGQRQEDRSPVIQLTVTARGAPIGQGRQGLVGFFRLAHEWIVNGFAAVTTDAAQEGLWERMR